SSATFPANHSRAVRQTRPQARRCAPEGVEVRAASSRRSAMTRCAFMSLLTPARISATNCNRRARRRHSQGCPPLNALRGCFKTLRVTRKKRAQGGQRAPSCGLVAPRGEMAVHPVIQRVVVRRLETRPQIDVWDVALLE